jgi:hypothetical protein
VRPSRGGARLVSAISWQLLRDRVGYSKVDVPFLEFLWANHLRQQVPSSLLKDDPKKALDKALKLASCKECSFLPGWCGKA